MKRHLRQYGLMSSMLGMTFLLACAAATVALQTVEIFGPWHAMALLPPALFAAVLVALSRRVKDGRVEWEGARSAYLVTAMSLASAGVLIGLGMVLVWMGRGGSDGLLSAAVVVFAPIFVLIGVLIWLGRRR